MAQGCRLGLVLGGAIGLLAGLLGETILVLIRGFPLLPTTAALGRSAFRLAIHCLYGAGAGAALGALGASILPRSAASDRPQAIAGGILSLAAAAALVAAGVAGGEERLFQASPDLPFLSRAAGALAALWLAVWAAARRVGGGAVPGARAAATWALRWGRRRLALAGAIAGAAVLLGWAPPREMPMPARAAASTTEPAPATGAWTIPLRPRNVVLVTIDALRADHLGCYGYPRPTSPTLDSLAAHGSLFETAIVQRPQTSPSFASLLTSLYPGTHGIWLTRQRLPESLTTLAEALATHGLQTAALVTNANLAPVFGFDQGYATYHYGREARAEEQTREALRWLRTEAREPFHLWIHYLDPHTPYDPPPAEKARLLDRSRERRTPLRTKRYGDNIGAVNTRKTFPRSGLLSVEDYRDLYDGEVAAADRAVGELVSGLRGLGLLESTLIVVTADHGEALGEHNYFFSHGAQAYEESVRVPLLFYFPAGLPASRRIEGLVEGVDIAPTIVSLLTGGTAPLAPQGRDLTPWLRGAEGPVRSATFTVAGYSRRQGFIEAVRTDRWKYVYRPNLSLRHPWTPGALLYFWNDLAKGIAPPELFDLRMDPAETLNLWERHPEVVAEMERIRLAHHRQFPDSGRQAASISLQDLAPDVRESLRALGYVD